MLQTIPCQAPTAPLRMFLLQLLPPELRTGARFLFHPNLECEEQWSANAVKLPRIQRADDERTLVASDELALLAMGEPDMVLVRKASDPGFLAYLRALGFQLPRLVVMPEAFAKPEPSDATGPIVTGLGNALVEGRTHLLAHGNTSQQETLSAALSTPLVGSAAAIAATVNSKIFSRRLVTRLGLTCVPGRECESVEDLDAAYQELRRSELPRGPLVLKEALGVSGKGLMIIDSDATFDSVRAMLNRRAKPERAFAFVLERWIDKTADVNYQFLVPPNGAIRLLGIKDCIVERGIHRGHQWPARLTGEQVGVYRRSAELIGAALRDEGFVGIVGVDSIIARDGTVYPVLEINARFNMSTYELALDSLVPPDRTTVVKMYHLSLSQPVAFEDLRRRLEGTLFGIDSVDQGVGILTFNGVNCNVDSHGEDARGRCWAWLVGRTAAELAANEARLVEAFVECGCRVVTA